MILDTKTRGVLEQIIDSLMQSTPTLTKAFFDPQAKERLLIQNEKDFLIGMDLGMIQHAFWSKFFSMYEREPNEQELSEAGNIILNRISQIREATFKT